MNYLNDLEVSMEQYNRWYKNIKKSKAGYSFMIHIVDDGTIHRRKSYIKRKVEIREDLGLRCKSIDGKSWHRIELRQEEDECDACEGKCKSNETEKCDDCGVELRIGCANNPSDHSIFNDCCDDCRVEEDCNCILRGNNICYNEFNCENCGECLNWKGYEEGTKNCGECRLNLNKDLN
mgnify:CR=1 FL=1